MELVIKEQTYWVLHICDLKTDLYSENIYQGVVCFGLSVGTS